MMPDGMDAVFFTNSGSESVDTALKIALGYHHARGEAQRTRLVGRQRGYHGSGFGGTSVGGIGNNRIAAGPMLPGVFHLPETYDLEHQAFSKGQPSWGAHLANIFHALLRATTRAPSRQSLLNRSLARAVYWYPLSVIWSDFVKSPKRMGSCSSSMR
jgi:adenosylmethionine-8-amino-7-oxononanoate aminotransferase